MTGTSLQLVVESLPTIIGEMSYQKILFGLVVQMFRVDI